MKIISVVLVFALMYFSFACHSLRVISHCDEIRENLESGEEVYVMTDDSTKYNFYDPYTYKLQNDTLHGYAEKMIGENLASYDSVALDIDKITYIEGDNFDGGKTAVMFILVSGVWLVSFSDGGRELIGQ